MEQDWHIQIVRRGIGRRNDDGHAELTRVGGLAQVSASGTVAMVPARTRGTRGEHVTPLFTGHDRRRAFLVRAIDIRWDMKAMPVDHLVFLGIVEHVNDDGSAFLYAQ